MSKPMSLRREWLIRIITGLVMIPVAFLVAVGLAAILPASLRPVALVIGGLIFFPGSMVVSLLLIHPKAT